MKLLERILVPLDFGPRTDAVLATAASLAKTFDSEVHLLHVLPQLDGSSLALSDIMSMAHRGAEGRLAEVRSRLEEAGTAAAEAAVAEGTPFDRIIRHAEDIDANVIVVGSRRDDGREGLRIGTTTERLCRKSTKPVWIVGSESGAHPRTILCPVDGSGPSQRALRNGVHLARRFGARLMVLHVVRPISAIPGVIPAVQRGMERKHLESETARFEGLLRQFDFHGISWDKVLREGDPADAIIAVASESSAELIVMGSVGRTGLSRILLGSVAGKVAGRLPCSMVMVKAEDAIRLKLEEDLSDLGAHYARGWELLENGFLNEAKRQFEHCIQTSDIFLPAWEGLAEVCRRQDKPEQAEEHLNTARQIAERLEWRRVEAEIRRDHPLWNKP